MASSIVIVFICVIIVHNDYATIYIYVCVVRLFIYLFVVRSVCLPPSSFVLSNKLIHNTTYNKTTYLRCVLACVLYV